MTTALSRRALTVMICALAIAGAAVPVFADAVAAAGPGRPSIHPREAVRPTCGERPTKASGQRRRLICRLGAGIAVSAAVEPESPSSEPGAPAPGPAGGKLEGAVPPSAATPPDLPGLFAPDSVWLSPLGATAAIDPSSPQLIDALLGQIEVEEVEGSGPNLGIWSRTTLYRVGPEQPRVPVFLDTGPWGDALADHFGAGVPIPPGAQPVAGQDHAMTVWQPSTDSYWEFFDMEQELHAPQFSRSPVIEVGCGLLAGAYSYRLTSVNELGESAADATPLTVGVPLGGCVGFEWSPISGATGYKIYRAKDDSAPQYLATVPVGQTSFVDDGLALPGAAVPPTTSTADTPGEWHARFGGFISEVSESPGYYRDLENGEGIVVERSHWGAAATGLPLAGGLITRQDIEAGRIDHALSLGLINLKTRSLLRAKAFAFPAQRTDGRSLDENSIPEGARLRLDPDLEIDQLGLSPFAEMLAEAAQSYGMIVHDGSQGTVIYAEDPSPYVSQGEANFYRPVIGNDAVKAMRGFPWEHLQVVSLRLCTQRPCTAG